MTDVQEHVVVDSAGDRVGVSRVARGHLDVLDR